MVYVEGDFLSCFWKYINPELRNFEIRAPEISGLMDKEASCRGYPVISLDRIYVTNADGYVEVTRITDPVTGRSVIGERPGSRSINEQAEGIRGYGEVVLADVGAFEGKTIIEVCSLLEKNGVTVREILLGISSRDANSKMNSARKVNSIYTFDELYEWIELRDLLGIDGRNVGMKNGERIYIPYWENLPGWASIPEENQEDVKDICMYYNGEISGILEKEGFGTERIGKPVKMGGDL